MKLASRSRGTSREGRELFVPLGLPSRQQAGLTHGTIGIQHHAPLKLASWQLYPFLRVCYMSPRAQPRILSANAFLTGTFRLAALISTAYCPL